MNTQVALWALGAALTVALFVIQQAMSKLSELRRENQLLRDTVWDQKLAISELKGTGHAVNRTLGALPVPSEGGTP
jgi:hypothetical protein